MIAKGLIKNTKYRTGHIMGRHEILFQFLPFSEKNRWKKISPDKDICIEGFPRSANSFFAKMFRLYNPTAKAAHHMHAPLQVIKAVNYGIPCVVLIRNPIDAIASVLVVDRTLSTRFSIQSYINFYEKIWPVRDDVTISDFKDTTQRPQYVVERINQRYGTSFHMEPITPETRDTIFNQLQETQKQLKQPEHLVAIPTVAKARIKQDVLQELKEHPLLPTANSLYRRFLEI
ncbi:hypothetical protein D0962_33625 [Leptolyngbyaceae cyanobacterium CCMR0082]|uniref:Sulfotransferase n=3 Tax=Adonisia TaxID=2950183 RepID=A0A6M0SGN8_9CYAN|nr:hypothetical protein [Adonisia turfae CCMR0081]NEZ67645.1 hypothetical protein [Adonisia turfae CCMR0082]